MIRLSWRLTLLLLCCLVAALTVNAVEGVENKNKSVIIKTKTAQLGDGRKDEILALGRTIRQNPASSGYGGYGNAAASAPLAYSSPPSSGYPSPSYASSPPAAQYAPPSSPPSSYGGGSGYGAASSVPSSYQQASSSYGASPAASSYYAPPTTPTSPSTSVQIVYTPVISIQFGSKYDPQLLLSPNNPNSPIAWDNFTSTRAGAPASETIFINNTQLLYLPSSLTFRTIPHALTASRSPVGWLDNTEVTAFNPVPIIPLPHGRTRISATISGSQSHPSVIPFVSIANKYDDPRLGAAQWCVGTPNCMWLCFQLTSRGLWLTYISGRDTLLLAVPRANADVNARAYAVQTARIASSSPAQKHFLMVEYNSKDNVFVVFVEGRYVLTVPMPGLKLLNPQYQLIMERMGTAEALCTPAELFITTGITSRLDASDPNMPSSTTGLVQLVDETFESGEGQCGETITDVNGNIGTQPYYMFPTSFEQPTSPRWARLFGMGNTVSIYNLQVAKGEERDVYYAPPAAPSSSYAAPYAAPPAYNPPPPVYSAPPSSGYSSSGSYGQPSYGPSAAPYGYQGPPPPAGGPAPSPPQQPPTGGSVQVPASASTWW